eukprot:TRINITY_DN86590_c0_g1_i1.p1 TRINITY_DN86590_c0_g1~~TRINITY_DN86590_c0_g1_i1.p1  ORF type:complete len:112 (+),score=11.14 TRINITY_DN86590_c0_g1_i1:41-337(+)
MDKTVIKSTKLSSFDEKKLNISINYIPAQAPVEKVLHFSQLQNQKPINLQVWREMGRTHLAFPEMEPEKWNLSAFQRSSSSNPPCFNALKPPFFVLMQ